MSDYPPQGQGVNQLNLIKATIDGNIAGVQQLISTGTMTLAGGNNITISQNGNAITISAAAIGAGSFTAGASDLGNLSGTTGVISNQLVFAGGNNITLSQSIDIQSATITIIGRPHENQTASIVQAVVIGGNTSGTTASISSGTMRLAGGYNITLSQNQNSITLSGGEVLTAVVSNLGNTAGLTGEPPSGMDKLVLVGGSNITLSQTYIGEDVTITIDGQSQSVQTQNLIGDVNIIGNTSGTTANISSGTLFIAGGNNITLSQDANSITVSAFNQSQQTQLIVNVNIGGNTSGTTADITSGTLSILGGYNITLSQNQNTIEISGGEVLTAVVSNLGNTAGLTGAPAVMDKLIFVGGNNVTLSQTYVGEDVTITINAQTQSLQTQNIIRDVNIIGNTTGTTAEITSGTLSIAGGNNITLSQAGGNAITIEAQSQSQQTQNIIRDVNIGGNTSGTTANITSGTLFLAGNYNITLSQNQNSISISGPDAIIGGMTTLGNTAGDNTLPVHMESLILVGGNNITLSQSTFDEFATVTISGANQTIQTQNIVRDVNIAGNTSGTTADITSGTLILAGGNNITLSQVGNAITISAFEDIVTQFSAGMSDIGNTTGTTGLAINQLVLAGGNEITLSGSTDGNSMTITISGASDTIPVFSAGISAGIGVTSGTTGFATERLVFAGGNNITLSQSINDGSATLTISARNQTVQTQNLIDVTIAGNTSGTLALISSGTLTLAGGNNITLSQDGNAITISAPEDVITQFSAAVSNIGNTSGDTGTIDNIMVFAGGNNITLSQSRDGQSGTITISAYNQTVQTQGLIRDVNITGNTSGTTAEITSGTLSLAGGDNITLSQNGNAITISAAAVGAGSFTAGASNLGNVVWDYWCSKQ